MVAIPFYNGLSDSRVSKLGGTDMLRSSKYFLTAFIILGLTFHTAVSAEPMKSRVDTQPKSSDFHYHSLKRYKKHSTFNRFPDYSSNIRRSHFYWFPKRHKRNFKPDVIYVIPEGSNILIYNGNRYYRWKDRYYQPVVREGKKAYISVNLNF